MECELWWVFCCGCHGGIDTLVRDEAPTVVLDGVRQEQRRGLSIRPPLARLDPRIDCAGHLLSDSALSVRSPSPGDIHTI